MKKTLLILLISLSLVAGENIAPLKTKNLLNLLEQKNNYAALTYIYGSIENMNTKKLCFKSDTNINDIAISILSYSKLQLSPAPLAKNFLQNALHQMYKCGKK